MFYFGRESAMIVYQGNPKHKHPWQCGRRGGLCPRSMTIQPQQLLEQSVLADEKRYATLEGRCYCAQEDSPNHWHGYPVPWREVPERIWRTWRNEGIIKKSDIDKYW